jgi:hypothetical protein
MIHLGPRSHLVMKDCIYNQRWMHKGLWDFYLHDGIRFPSLVIISCDAPRD